MVSKDSLIKAVDGDLVKVKSSEKKKSIFCLSPPFQTLPKRLYVKIFEFEAFVT